ncbi:hypothetical protein Aph01nite_17490 [Acrocarpospora phusangensis]|uniref:Uncharacterized protein n=1 Tax=Acrocarpospora phusangensis TaxID=1070424 RepID=A0A919Q926_9ACTN|nr:hypothetical protein [Acrocarpospora phusangensis]GIH23439.1 hypothetical protein Aph01nite_17490 [Acrocarpospora phusangensis]
MGVDRVIERAQTLVDVLTAAAHPDPDYGADLLVMLRDGAMVAGYLGSPKAAADNLRRAVQSFARDLLPDI